MASRTSKKLLSIVIPFYNEEENVSDVIKGLSSVLKEAGINYEIIAVNNGSSDKTPEIIESFRSTRVIPLHIKKNEGYGNGILRGMAIANGGYIGSIPGDNEVKPQTVVDVFRKLVNEKLDLCKISRVVKNYGFFRILESKVYNKIFVRVIFGYKTEDINGSPKIMTRAAFAKLNPIYKDSFIDTEIMIKAAKLKLKSGEVPAVYTWRKKGKSTVQPYIALEFIKNALKFKASLIFENARTAFKPK